MKKLLFLSFTLLLVAAFSACGSTDSKSSPQDVPATSDSSKVTAEYICPCGHCGYPGGNQPGECPKCGMALELKP